MSEIILSLYDHQNGGPAQAFKCLLKNHGKPRSPVCGMVTRTLRGMRSHQLYLHNFKPQAALFQKPDVATKEITDECCMKHAPEFSGKRQDGQRFTCSDCGTTWVWTIDEAEGSYWEDTVGAAV